MGTPAPTAPPRPAADGRYLRRRILAWYDRAGRDLPWRTKGGDRPDPYRVWLSEIMLQQTTVAVVRPYFERFIERWASVGEVARAELDEVLHAWQGLGYYGRARNLHRCAQLVDGASGGHFPDSEQALSDLPGIGPYSAAAIAAIAFGRRAVVVDGNVERVMARLYGVTQALPGAKARLRRLAEGLTPAARPGDYAQAVMDLGATLCTPRRPRCDLCPWAGPCVARASGVPERLPLRTPRRARPTKFAVAFWARRADGAVLLRQRPRDGLLGGMFEVPSTPWRAAPWSDAEAMAYAPAVVDWRRLDGEVRHGFTHFRVELVVLEGDVGGQAGAAGGRWSRLNEVAALALPTLTKKVIGHALAAHPKAAHQAAG